MSGALEVMDPSLSSAAPGRSCPLHYRYDPAVFGASAPSQLQDLDVLYVVGGLYGNEAALDRLIELFDAEHGRKQMVFNGDFHWFDVDERAFARIQDRVLHYVALRGNVETELAEEADPAQPDAGCGCAYPDWVDSGVVERSNRIHARLRSACSAHQRQELAALAPWQRADVGPLRLGLVHGDAQSLAGWGFAQEHLADAAHRAQVRDWFTRAQVDAFVCTHTCLPVYQRLHTLRGERWVLNNGAAGMPNFRNTSEGLITRIAKRPYRGPARRFGVQQSGVHHEALALTWNRSAMLAQFVQHWPPGSDAHVSYASRLRDGPAYDLTQAVRDDL